jgi:putative hemolysin
MRPLIIALLIVATALISAAETAVFALRRVDILRWKEEGNRRGRIIERMLESPNRLITTIFILNELTNVTISSMLAALIIPSFPRHGEIVALVAGTFSILVLGNLVPKSIAWPRARGVSLLSAGLLEKAAWVISPVRFLFEKAAEGLVFLLSAGRVPRAKAAISEREFRALVDVGEEAGTLDEGEKRLIHNIFDLTDRRAGEIMTPLGDVLMVPVGAAYEELLDKLRRFRRSRIPAYEGEPGNIVGILYTRDLLRFAADGEPGPAWTDLLAPPFVIPSSKKLPLLLREFQRRKVHLALVVDEFGEVVGIVTLEDVLEELFGDIREEHDREDKEVVRRPDGSFRVLARMPIYRFNETFEADLPYDEWDTVAGLLLHEFGRLPVRGDSIVLSSFRFTVERLKGIRIAEVSVQRVKEREEAEPSP